MEADFAQLEFRVAAFLSQDMTAIDEVVTGFDVHCLHCTRLSQMQVNLCHVKTPRHTPLLLCMVPVVSVGHRQKRHTTSSLRQSIPVLLAWHKRLATEALNTGMITTPSGREFAFPDVSRRRFGGVTYFTQIKNYPVQSFATADIVPISLIYIDKLLTANKLTSCVVNTVHDSVVIDVHPDEKDKVLRVIQAANDKLISIVNRNGI